MSEINLQRKELINLLNRWDPIGVYPFEGGPQDEYECFVKPILSLLVNGKGKRDIIVFLKKHLEHHVGVTSASNDVNNFAEEILLWWIRTKP